jgi:hypothetical protein
MGDSKELGCLKGFPDCIGWGKSQHFILEVKNMGYPQKISGVERWGNLRKLFAEKFERFSEDSQLGELWRERNWRAKYKVVIRIKI